MNEWISNFNNNEGIPFVTTSALIGLKDLEDFIAAIKKQQADSVRIYFLRFRPFDVPTPQVLVNGVLADGCKWRDAAGGFTQTTIAMVPAKNFQRDKDFIFSAEDIILDGVMTTLIPGTDGEGTGLNPPSPGAGIPMGPKG